MGFAVHSWDKLHTPQITIMYLAMSVSFTALGNSKRLCFPTALVSVLFKHLLYNGYCRG